MDTTNDAITSLNNEMNYLLNEFMQQKICVEKLNQEVAKLQENNRMLMQDRENGKQLITEFLKTKIVKRKVGRPPKK